MGRRRGVGTRAVVVGALVCVVAGLGWAVSRTQALPEGPSAVAWDRDACAHCHMHVSEPRFAAQLQAKDGRVLHFDDPGCLLSLLGGEHPEPHAIWLHHHTEDRWLQAHAAAFVEATATPMGFGLGAVDASTPGATSFDDAKAQVAARSRRAEHDR